MTAPLRVNGGSVPHSRDLPPHPPSGLAMKVESTGRWWLAGRTWAPMPEGWDPDSSNRKILEAKG